MSYSALPTCAGCKVTIYGTPIPVQGEDHCSVECCWDAGQAAGYLNAAADAEDYPSLEDNLERAQRRIGELVAERDRLLDEVERWKLASGLEDGRGDPDGVTPEAMQRYWEGFEANHRDLQRTVKERLDRLATICGCPEWDYPGQIVRDVEAVAKERDRLRAALDVVRQAVLAADYSDTLCCFKVSIDSMSRIDRAIRAGPEDESDG
jgi:hypothetical protein